MGDVLMECSVCGMEVRCSLYKNHICLGHKLDEIEKIEALLEGLFADEEFNS
ncbi:MAG: hypothetical protein M1409_07830 [Actinobacteria bacterium]|nr:hypothetical protein [Actinomycetota bacterium]